MIPCYLIQSHRSPEQIWRLVRTLRRGSARGKIVVQHDRNGEPLDLSELAALPDVYTFSGEGPQVRSNYSCQIGPWVEAIGWLDRSGIEYDWIVSMTAQDYPVAPVREIEAFLQRSAVDAYLRFWDVFGEGSPWSKRKARKRYWYRYWWLPPTADRWLRILKPLTRLLPVNFYLDYGAVAGVRRLSTPFGNLRCHGGWAWYSLRRDAARYVRSFLEEHPDVEAHYRTTIAPEESVVPTILANSRSFQLVNDDLRYVDYEHAVRGSPRVLTMADYGTVTSGRYHWARKFDLSVDREVLDRIDEEIHPR